MAGSNSTPEVVEDQNRAQGSPVATREPISRAASEGVPPAAGEPLTDKPARLIVCGGRDFHDYYRLANVMDRLRAIRPIAMIFHGNARGADTLADRWCRERGVTVHAVPAEWAKHGKAAGPKRNQAMLGQGIDLVVAFPGGRGTEDMVKRAKAAGVLVTRAVAKPGLRPPPTSDAAVLADRPVGKEASPSVAGVPTFGSASRTETPNSDGKED